MRKTTLIIFSALTFCLTAFANAPYRWINEGGAERRTDAEIQSARYTKLNRRLREDIQNISFELGQINKRIQLSDEEIPIELTKSLLERGTALQSQAFSLLDEVVEDYALPDGYYQFGLAKRLENAALTANLFMDNAYVFGLVNSYRTILIQLCKLRNSVLQSNLPPANMVGQPLVCEDAEPVISFVEKEIGLHFDPYIER